MCKSQTPPTAKPAESWKGAQDTAAASVGASECTRLPFCPSTASLFSPPCWAGEDSYSSSPRRNCVPSRAHRCCLFCGGEPLPQALSPVWPAKAQELRATDMLTWVLEPVWPLCSVRGHLRRTVGSILVSSPAHWGVRPHLREGPLGSFVFPAQIRKASTSETNCCCLAQPSRLALAISWPIYIGAGVAVPVPPVLPTLPCSPLPVPSLSPSSSSPVAQSSA